ncbi:hypothetical protein TcYC6_0005230 [Trypanosoma cruzi]|nr:hypothetical protein TcYC6_0005230 [Trypanosoma cruzi]
MKFELANDLTQATRNTHPNASSPDVTAYRVLRVTHWRSTLYMDLDHCLISYSVGMDDGIPRIANTLPRREKATSALRKADWPAFTSLCETLLAADSTWSGIRRGILRAAERHIPRGSRDSPQESRRTEWSRPSLLRRQHATSVLSYREAACPELKCSTNGRTAIIPFAVFSPCCQRSVRNSLVSCDAPRHGGTTSLPFGIGCAAALLGARLCSASAAGNLLVRHTVRVASAAILTVVCTVCACVPSGDWDMDWPFTPCAPDSAIRDCLPGVAPGPGGVLNVFLRHLVPAARCLHRTIINTSLADGSLRSCWEMGNTTPIRRHGKDTCRTERVAGPSRCSLPLLGVSEGLVHSRL